MNYLHLLRETLNKCTSICNYKIESLHYLSMMYKCIACPLFWCNFPTCLLYFMVIKISFIFKKKVRISILILVTNFLQFQTETNYIIPPELSLWADSTLSSCHFTNCGILRIINNQIQLEVKAMIKSTFIC